MNQPIEFHESYYQPTMYKQTLPVMCYLPESILLFFNVHNTRAQFFIFIITIAEVALYCFIF